MTVADDTEVELPVLRDLDVAAEQFAQLWATAGEDEGERARLREELIGSCLPFAGRLARRFAGRGESIEDLEQVARLGLIKAVDRYNPGRGSFTAFAVVTVTGEIKRHFRDRTWGVHVPRRLRDLHLEIRHASMLLSNRLTRQPTAAELATHLRVAEAAVVEAMESAAGYAPISLSAQVAVGPQAAEVGDLLGVVDRDLELVDDRLTVSHLLLQLPARERRMLALRFYGNRTQAEIAAELGISQMHVSRLLSRSLAWLREAMLSDVTPPWGGVADAAELQITESVAGNVQTIRIQGEIDRDCADGLHARLRRAITSGECVSIVVDLRGVATIDAAGVSVLLAAVKAAEDADVDLVLAGTQPYVARNLAIAGLRPRPVAVRLP